MTVDLSGELINSKNSLHGQPATYSQCNHRLQCDLPESHIHVTVKVMEYSVNSRCTLPVNVHYQCSGDLPLVGGLIHERSPDGVYQSLRKY